MKLNSKGYMLVEIILASVIAMSIAYYLLNLTYKFKDKNEDVYYSTELISLKNNITKNIMNNLEKSTITDVNYYDKYNITFKANDENRKISLIKQDGKISKIKYGKIDNVTNDFDTTDSSYYQKEFASYIEVGEPELKTFNSGNNGILTITIPISNIYDKNSYDIILTLKNENYTWNKRPIIIHYCLNGGYLESGADTKTTEDEIVYFEETNHYLTPNDKDNETNDNIQLLNNNGQKFAGWYVKAKNPNDENEVYWIGCTSLNNKGKCTADMALGHGWYKRDDSSLRGYFLGNEFNHLIGYKFAQSTDAYNIDKVELHELWLYACWTSDGSIAECHDINNLPADDAECKRT